MNILLVDDSKSARYALRLQLQRYGVDVDTEDAAESALERVRSIAPDAIFMDHTMPGMNGFEALDILKAASATRHIPVVMCTSNEDPEFTAQAIKKGALDILSKSTAGEKLGNLIERLQQAVAKAGSTVAAEKEAVFDSAPRAELPPATTSAIAEERLEERIRSLIGLQMNEMSARLAADFAAKTDAMLASRMSEEVGRLQKNFIKAQSEQAQLTTTRLMNDVLPKVVRKRFEREKQDIMHMLPGLIETTINGLVDEPSFRRRILDFNEASTAATAERLPKRQVDESTETPTPNRAGHPPAHVAGAPALSMTRIYLLAAGSALVGIGSAAVVFVLLS